MPSRFTEDIDGATAFDPKQSQKGRLTSKAKHKPLIYRIVIALFCLVEIAYLGLSAYCMYTMAADWSKETDFTSTSLTNIGLNDHLQKRNETISMGGTTTSVNKSAPPINSWMFIYATGVAVGINVVFICVLPYFSGILVWLGPVAIFTAMAAEAGVFAYLHIWEGAIINAVLCCFTVLAVILARKRFQLAKHCLQTVAKTMRADWGILLWVFNVLMIQFLLAIFNVLAVVAIALRFEPLHKECSTGVFCSSVVTILGCGLAITAHLWLSAVISDVMIVALAGGPFSTTYFVPRNESEAGVTYAVKQALGHSLGAAAFGSLLTGILHFIHGLFSVLAQSDDGVLGVCFCLLSGVLRLLENLLKWFNKYIFIFIALGKRQPGMNGQMEVARFEATYFEAARFTWSFIVKRPKFKGANRVQALLQWTKCHGIATVINDSIAASAMHMAALATGFLCGLFTFAYMHFIDQSSVTNHTYDWVIVIYATLLGILLGLPFSSAMDIGVSTLYVCMSEDIRELQHVNPEMANFVRKNYPEMFGYLEGKANGREDEEDPARWKQMRSSYL